MRAKLADVQEMTRFTPARALPLLPGLEAEAKTLSDQSDVLTLSCDIQHRLGHHQQAMELCGRALDLGHQARDNDAIARAMLYKAYVLFSLAQIPQAHQMIWDAEKLAANSRDMDLRVRTVISSGESFAEEGNFPVALTKLHDAVGIAQQSDILLLKLISLDALAYLYNQMRESTKAFETLDIAIPLARQLKFPGRLARLRSTEYGLAMDSGQFQRGLRALTEAMQIQRAIGEEVGLATSLVNLSDCYLKLRNYPLSLSYAQQAMELAKRRNDDNTVATSRLNIGQVYLAMGRVADGKKIVEEGLAQYEKVGNKPDLQSALLEYGEALEQAGDRHGALRAYKRERALSNELFEAQRHKAVMELQERFEAEKKMRQIDLLRKENQVKSTELDNRRLEQRIWWLLAVIFALSLSIIGYLLKKVRTAHVQLTVKNDELKRQRSQDPLTSLYNRRHFQEFMAGDQAPQLADAANETETVGALFLLDVDHFKRINDTYGHAAGDVVLRELGVMLRETLRETDMIVRWGGEEFLAFLPEVSREKMDDVARRLLSRISGRPFTYERKSISVTVSIGFAPFPLVRSGEVLSWERSLNLVDMALYLAKARGRNRAYGLCGFTPKSDLTLEQIEQDLEHAWETGHVRMSTVQNYVPELGTLLPQFAKTAATA